MKELVQNEYVVQQIYLFRNKKVMLDRDLAKLYRVETKVLKQAVRRNQDRFPSDFMFELSVEELQKWRSQFVTSKRDKMGLRYAPMAFTEQGIAMLSTVLHSKRAIQINIAIMRVFVRIREMLASNEEIKQKVELLERTMSARLDQHDKQFRSVFEAFEAIKQLMTPPEKPKRRIGFHT